VAFALVWAEGDAALNRNEAYALANCTGCTTVAVAFQVVLLVGSVDVVVPRNVAAAVNYACIDCVTQALATQLVVSLDGPLDDDGRRRLAEIWTELEAFAADAPGLPLAELRDRLTAYEQRIIDVVGADAESGTGTREAEAEPTSATTESTAGSPADATDGAVDGGADGDTDGETDAVPTTSGPTSAAPATTTSSAPVEPTASPSPSPTSTSTGTAQSTSSQG
jgi:putative peptide zinc metalloprotease protein